MASIQYTGLVSGMQGKLNGSVLSRGRSGNVIYRKPVQRLEPTQAQLANRSQFSAIASFWRDLTPEERADWAEIADENPLPDRFGEPRIVSGYAYFQRMLSLGSPSVPPEALPPVIPGDSVYEFTPVDSELSISLTDAGYLIEGLEATADTLNDSPVQNNWNLYISLPVADFEVPYFKTWYLVSQGLFDASLGSAAELLFEAPEALMPKGFRSFEGAKHLLKGVTFIRNQGGVSVEQVWNSEPNWGPVVYFPSFEYDSDNMPSIAYDGSDGIIDYYWKCTEGALIRSDFTAQTQFAPPQATQGPVPDEDWADITSTGFTSSGGSGFVIPTPPGGPTSWYGVWYTDVGSAWTPVNDWWAPVRMRLIHIATGQEGPWTVGYWPITIV